MARGEGDHFPHLTFFLPVPIPSLSPPSFPQRVASESLLLPRDYWVMVPALSRSGGLPHLVTIRDENIFLFCLLGLFVCEVDTILRLVDAACI